MAINPLGAGNPTRQAMPAAPGRMIPPGGVDPTAALAQAAALQRAGGAGLFAGRGMASRRPPSPLAQFVQQIAAQPRPRPVARRPAGLPPMGAPAPGPFRAIDRYVQAHAAHKDRQASAAKVVKTAAAQHDALVHHLEGHLRAPSPQGQSTLRTAAAHPVGRQLLGEAMRNVKSGGAPRGRRALRRP